MKKFTLFSAFAVFLSACAIGCSSDGTNSFCRLGSIFPTVRSSQDYGKDKIYLQTTGTRNIGNCLPCEEVQPCSPCEPVCNPCDNTCTGAPGRLMSSPVPSN